MIHLFGCYLVTCTKLIPSLNSFYQISITNLSFSPIPFSIYFLFLIFNQLARPSSHYSIPPLPHFQEIEDSHNSKTYPSHPILPDQMDRPRFVIEATEVESMAKKSGVSILELLPSLVKSAKKLARPPISKYHVGAVGLGSNGRIFFGVNLEFPGLPLHQSVHAEQFLITNALINRESQINYFAVSSAPCGHCRQFLQEIRGATDIKILITSSDNGEEEGGEFKPISGFLPHRFGPDDLLEKNVPLLLEPHDNGLVLVECNHVYSNGTYCNGNVDIGIGKLKIAAFEAANASHAPYSGCPSGVAIMDSDGKVYKGSYTESAAYNPSLGPIQAALVAYIASGGGGYEKIVAGVLVEKEGAMVGQEGTARLLLKTISPQCDFRVFHCESWGNNCQ